MRSDEHFYGLLQHVFVEHVKECPSYHAKDLASFLDISSNVLFCFHVFHVFSCLLLGSHVTLDAQLFSTHLAVWAQCSLIMQSPN